MKVNVIGMILNNAGRRSFDAAVLDDNGKPLPAADSLHAMIMEYAKVFNGGTSDLVSLSREVLAQPQAQQPAVAQGAGEVVSDYYPELLIARSAVQELEQKVFSLEQCKAILQASVASYQRDMVDPPAYLQDAVIKAAGLGAMAEQIAALKKQVGITQPAAGADAQLLDAMQRYRIAVVPEFEGPWDATVYGDEGEPQFTGSGDTPRDAIRAAIAASGRQE